MGVGGSVCAPWEVAELNHHRGEVLMGEHDALGRPGGAAGEGKNGQAGEGVYGRPAWRIVLGSKVRTKGWSCLLS